MHHNTSGGSSIMCKIEVSKSGVCAAGVHLSIHGRHVWLGDAYEYKKERVLLRLNSHFRGGTRVRRLRENQVMYGGGWEIGGGYPTGKIYTADARTEAEEGSGKFLKNYTRADIRIHRSAQSRRDPVQNLPFRHFIKRTFR